MIFSAFCLPLISNFIKTSQHNYPSFHNFVPSFVFNLHIQEHDPRLANQRCYHAASALVKVP
ncbi:hypothetical protein S83_070782, partial [Arachis hypogaea]